MKFSTTLLFCLMFLLAGPVAGQDFRVIDSTPGDGTAGVALETEVVFQFSSGVDLNTSWNSAFFVEPRSTLETSKIFLGLDDEGRPAVVEFTVKHSPSTDYVWLMYEVMSKNGEVMSEPFVLQYSTAPDIGSREITGGLGVGAITAGKAANVRSHLRHVAELAQENGWAETREINAEAVAKGGALQGGHVLVLLLRNYALRSSAWDVKSATVVGEAAESYVLEHVRDGTYWPLAIKYAEGSKDIEQVGFYDANGDSEPDSVVVSGGDRSQIDLLLFDYPRATAATYLERARAEADLFADDQELIIMRGGFGTTYLGTAHAWYYEFYSASTSLLTSVRIDPLGAEVDTSAAEGSVTSLRSISESFIDSDEALQVAEAHGGSDFRARFNPEQVVTSVQAGNLSWFYPEDEERLFWRARYVAFSGGVVDEMSVLVDMYSAVVLSEEKTEGLPGNSLRAANYPNPFTSSTKIDVDMPTAGQIKVSVYNLLGQQVAVLLDEYRPAGTYTVTWDARDAPSGAYLFRIEADGMRKTGTMHLLD